MSLNLIIDIRYEEKMYTHKNLGDRYPNFFFILINSKFAKYLVPTSVYILYERLMVTTQHSKLFEIDRIELYLHIVMYTTIEYLKIVFRIFCGNYELFCLSMNSRDN